MIPFQYFVNIGNNLETFLLHNLHMLHWNNIFHFCNAFIQFDQP